MHKLAEEISLPIVFRENECRVYIICRFDNQVPNGKLVKQYFLVINLAQYFACEEDRKLASY